MRRWLWLLPLLIAAPTQAGSLAMTMTTGSDVCPTVAAATGGIATTTCVKITDTDLARIFTANQAFLMGGARKDQPAPTDAMILRTMTMRMIQRAINRTQSFERAKLAVPSIPATPQ